MIDTRDEAYQRLSNLIHEYLQMKKPLNDDVIIEADRAYKAARLLDVYGGHEHEFGNQAYHA